MKNKINRIIVSIPLILIILMLFNYDFHSNEIELDDFLDRNEIDYGSVDNIISEREGLDSTIWKDEVLAQIYEQSIVSLWDSIRLKENKFKQIENFKFERILIPKFSTKTLIEKGIYKSIYSGNKESVIFRKWLSKMKRWKKQITISHVEFHQKEFYPSPEQKSLYSFTFHLKSEIEKYIINGLCNVEWSDKKDIHDNHIAKQLIIDKFDILSYSGDDSFKLTQIIGTEGDKSFYGPGMPIALVDLNDDELSELLIISANKIYVNKNGKFEKPIDLIKEFPENLLTSAIFGDFNNDGLLDILCFGRDMFPLLYEGEGKITFDKKPKIIRSILEPLIMPIASTSGDVDGDNDLDVLITQYKSPYIYGQMPTPYYDANDGFPSYLLINDGQGNFKDMTKEFGLSEKRFRRTYSCSFVDLDKDNILDLITVNDFAGIDIYKNDGNKFTDITKAIISEKSSFGMSHSIADYNLDGKDDLFVLGMSSTTANRLEQMNLNRPGYDKRNSARAKMGYGNRLYTKTKNGNYEEYPFESINEIVKTGWSWGVTSMDMDNDMDPDLYITNGNMSKKTAKDYCSVYWRHDVYTGNSQSNKVLKDFFADLTYNIELEGMSWNPFETNHLIMNLNGNDFIKIGYLYDVALENDSRCTISDDINNDGLTDIIVSTTRHHSYFVDGKFPDESIYIFKNEIESAKKNNWVGIILKTEVPGFHQIGTTIHIKMANGIHLEKSMINGDSFRSIHPMKKTFGLGSLSKIESIEVKWPNGIKEEILNPIANKYYSFPSELASKKELSLR
tara:strand:- start:14758 stop:17124 length:2367 start_codon:yes stop_codon:yes gene_type:complete